MKENTYRILDTLGRKIGTSMSINEIKNNIKQFYGTADYKNIYTSIQEMEKSHLITLQKVGQSSVAKLNFENSLLIDLLAEMELRQKTLFLENKPDMQFLLMEISMKLKEFHFIQSISLIDPKRNSKLNRIELLILFMNTEITKNIENHIKKIKSLLKNLAHMNNVRIDHILIDENTFLELLVADESNVAREMLSDKIVISNPQNFWLEIMTSIKNGKNIIVDQITNPGKISEKDMIFNLSRFGYREFGTKILQGKLFSIEYLVIGILLNHKSIRRLEAIPIILGKNKFTNYDLLVFLATKFQVLRKLYEILKLLNEIKPSPEISKIIQELKQSTKNQIKKRQDTISLDLKDIEEKMRLYDVIE